MSHGNNQIQIVDLADNVNAAVDKINENFELVETGTFSSVDSSSVTNIVNNILDSDYFTTIINEDYITNITTNLNVDLTDVEAGIAANASAISSLTTSINSTDSGITVLSQQITATQASVDGLVLDGFDSDALISAVTSANSSITSRIDADSDSLVVFSQILDSVESQLLIIDSDLGVRIDAEASARSSLSSTVGTQGGLITSLSEDITKLDNAVFMFDSNGDPLLDSNGNPQTAIASATDSLTTSIEATIDGRIQTAATWNLELIAGTESDPRFAGIQFGNDGQQADFALTADKFKIINPDSTTDTPIIPFSVDVDGATLTNVKVTGNLDIGANLSGAHMEMKDDVTKIFDSAGQLRVQLGNLTV